MQKTKIEWCDMTWNPVTGCLHGCPYCYARGIANRFGGAYDHDLCVNRTYLTHETTAELCRGVISTPMQRAIRKGGRLVMVPAPYPMRFAPTFHAHLLDQPSKIKKPKNIFVTSMGDLFGDWVPDKWITDVFTAANAAPQHRYLFLTKNGSRYEQLNLLPDNKKFWYGTTRTGLPKNERGASDHGNIFLSIEPILAPVDTDTMNAIELWNWVIVGAETGNRKEKVIPDRNWIMDIKDACRESGTPLFMKNSLKRLMGKEFIQEFPW